MSELIKITIVSENDKSNNATDCFDEKSIVLTHDPSATLMSTLQRNHLMNGSFCGGRGDCGRCRVRFLRGATIPTPLERSALQPEELRQGYRLACLAKPKSDCVIAPAFLEAPGIRIVSDMMDMTEDIDYNSQNIFQTKKQKPIVTKSHDIKKLSFGNAPKTEKNNMCNQTGETEAETAVETVIAVDLGTTTIAMQLVTLHTGQILDTWCEMNPQRRYGADVLSRIQASCGGAREELKRLAEEALERGVAQFCGCGTVIRCMCIAGNTTMEHLLMGHDVTSLGRSPFMPAESGLQSYTRAEWPFPVYVLPVISAFVGGDIVAGLYACGMLSDTARSAAAGLLTDLDGEAGREPEHDADKEDGTARLLIDLGTNGEMAIADGARMISTAAAAGPAFEGGAGADVVGSDMIACTAALLAAGIADGNGLLAEPYFTEGVTLRREGTAAYVPVSAVMDSEGDARGGAGTAAPVLSFRISQADIRAIQMAKAAVRAGVEILWRRMGEPGNVRVYLAGGFGYYLDVEAAFRIGLLPDRMRDSVRAVGNTSLGGAYLLGRDLVLGRIDRAVLERSLSSIESLNLAAQEEFESLYIRYMDLRVS